MVIPLYGFLEGDTLGLLVLAEEDETVLELARKLQNAANLRVATKTELTSFTAAKQSILP